VFFTACLQGFGLSVKILFQRNQACWNLNEVVMRKTKLLVVVMLSAIALTSCRSESSRELKDGFADPRALEIAEKIVKALGGAENFNAVRYLSFHYVVMRDTVRTSDWRHDWDRFAGDYRLEGKNDKGEELLVFFNVNNRRGEAFKNGLVMEGEELASLLEFAYGRFINDAYWLLMPYKLRDPGVMLTFDGEQTIDNQKYEIIKLTFVPSAGLTPQNVYRVFVDPATSQIHRWEYFQEEGKEPRPALWRDWRSFDGITLAEERIFEGRPTRLLFENIVVSKDVPPGLFTARKGLAMIE
jgi:hypothetical protein